MTAICLLFPSGIRYSWSRRDKINIEYMFPPFSWCLNKRYLSTYFYISLTSSVYWCYIDAWFRWDTFSVLRLQDDTKPPPQILKQNNPPPKPQILDYQSNVIVWDLLSKKAIFWMSRLVIQSCKNCYSTYFFPTLKMSYVTKMLINTGRNNNVALSYTFCSFLLYESIYEKSIKQWWWNTYVSHFNGF